MKANLLLCLLPCLIDSFEVNSTGIPPIATPINDSFALINYQDSFKIKFFSEVYAIEILDIESNAFFARIFQDEIFYPTTQELIPYELVEGEDLIVGGLNLSQCQTYKSLVVRMKDKRKHNSSSELFSI